MDTFIKASGGILVALIFCLVLSKQGKDISLLLTISVCVMVVFVAVEYLEPVISLFDKLQAAGNLDSEMLKIILKAVGVGLLSEVVSLICSDAGNAALGKTVQMLASAAILWISVPLYIALMELIEEVLVAA